MLAEKIEAAGGMPLLRYLSRNENKYAYRETKEEQMVSFARRLIDAQEMADYDEQLHSVIEQAKLVSSQLSGVLQNPSVRTLLVSLIERGQHFRTMPEMKLSFWSKQLSNIHGGVSGGASLHSQGR